MPTPALLNAVLAALLASAVLTLLGDVVEASGYPPRIVLGLSTTLANQAWGFANGGNDGLDGQAVVMVDLHGVTAGEIAAHKALGRVVQCYFSVGTAETWRPDYVARKWSKLSVKRLPMFPSEYWLDLGKLGQIKALMEPRFKYAKDIGCDAIEPDNTDCYANKECWKPLKKRYPKMNVKAKQIAYCKWQVHLAHSLGMSISLKNSLAIIPDLVDLYDFAVVEQCNQYSECNKLLPFVQRNKPVFNHEYTLGKGTNFCDNSIALGIQTKRCDGKPANGLCNASSEWKNCFDGIHPLPPRVYTVQGTWAPSKTPTRRPTRRPKIRKLADSYGEHAQSLGNAV